MLFRERNFLKISGNAIVRFMYFSILVSVIFAFMPIHAARVKDVEPPLPKAGQASKLSDTNLAFSNLVAIEMLGGALGTVHRVWKKNPQQSLNYIGVIHFPDGSDRHHQFKTFNELDRYVGKIRRRHTAFRKEAIRRGYKELAANYTATVSKDCAEGWNYSPSNGKATIKKQNFFKKSKFLFVLQQQDTHSYLVASIRDSVVISFPAPPFHPPLMGKIRGGRINLKDSKGKCTLKLVRD